MLHNLGFLFDAPTNIHTTRVCLKLIDSGQINFATENTSFVPHFRDFPGLLKASIPFGQIDSFRKEAPRPQYLCLNPKFDVDRKVVVFQLKTP